MNVLVVGGSGYVGGALTEILLNSSHSLRVYDGLFYEESYRKPVDFVFGDIRDTARLKPHVEWADVVVWLAALVGDPACALNPEISIEINQNTVKWLADNTDKRIVFLSTCSVYGAKLGELDESSPTNPLSVYAVTKLTAELAEARDMLKDAFENDATYKEHADAAKEANKVKSATKAQIMKQPQVAGLAAKVKSLTSEVKELKDGMSDYLKEFNRLSGITEIEGEDGELM